MVEPVESSKKFLAQLMRHEGTKKDGRGRHIAYRCPAGALTIGYGHNLDANPVPGLGEDSTLSDQGARELLGQDVKKIAAMLDVRLSWWRNVGEARSAVLLNMAFNIGVDGLFGFRNTLRAVREARWADAGSGMLASRWAGQVGRRAVELAAQMRSGEWQQGV